MTELGRHKQFVNCYEGYFHWSLTPELSLSSPVRATTLHSFLSSNGCLVCCSNRAFLILSYLIRSHSASAPIGFGPCGGCSRALQVNPPTIKTYTSVVNLPEYCVPIESLASISNTLPIFYKLLSELFTTLNPRSKLRGPDIMQKSKQSSEQSMLAGPQP